MVNIQLRDPIRILALRQNRKDSNHLLNQIKKQLPTGSKLISAGNKNTDIVMSGLIRVKRKRGRIKEMIKDDLYPRRSYAPTSDSTLNKSAFVAIDHLQRRTKQFTWRYHTLENVYDAKHYYHIALDLLTSLLEKEQINLVLFFDIPHLFYDTLIYQIAKSKGVRTLIFTSSPFPNRIFSLSAIEDVGIFPTVCKQDSNYSYPINANQNPNWDYMKGIEQYRGELGKLCWRGLFRLFWTFAAVERKKLSNPKIVLETIKRMRAVANALPKWRYPFLRHFHTRHLDYYEKILSYENTNVDYGRKFVYFPLHFQPEMTTSTLGGSYSDQLLAIEHLSKILPDDCSIYIKENPKQTGVMRGPQFFDRLERIPNLEFLPSYANTYQLIDKSEFVATVTGTAGWEAICKGKTALVFGMPWYRSLPGAIRFHKGITYEYIHNYKIEHSSLERLTGELYCRSHPVNAHLKNTMHSKLGEFTGACTFAETIVDLIENRIETTFIQS